jgi:HAD superfamily hydrolase (TIGR01509 family)
MNSPSTRTRLRAVLVDIDGTLIDSNDAHASAWQAVLRNHGHGFPHDAVRPLIGMGGDKVLHALLGLDAKSSEAHAISAERQRHFLQKELHGLKPTRGARELLIHLRAAGLQVVAATAAQGEESGALLRQAGVDDLIDDAASSSDAQQSKPDPDIVLASLHLAGVLPSEALMLGDTPYDIAAARSAGVGAVILRCGGWWNDDALAGALVLYDDPADLLERIGESPLSGKAHG